MLNSLKNLYFKFLNLIYNQKCLICGCSKTDDLLCKTCAKDVEYLTSFAHRIQNGIPVYSACNYDGIIKKLIHKLKFQHKKRASIVLGEILFEYFKQLNLKGDFILCYPSSFYLRSAHRGYNPSYLIALEFSKLSEIELIKDLILKVKYTKPQYKAKNKVKNIKGSYKLDKNKLNKVKNKTIILIDDITTSGATLNEIIDIFQKENIENLICITVARAVK